LKGRATIASIRHNPQIKAKYDQLKRQEKKPTKVAIIACARKVLRILNAMVRDNLTYTSPITKPT
jgi:hypothetical protein